MTEEGLGITLQSVGLCGRYTNLPVYILDVLEIKEKKY